MFSSYFSLTVIVGRFMGNFPDEHSQVTRDNAQCLCQPGLRINRAELSFFCPANNPGRKCPTPDVLNYPQFWGLQ